MLFARRERLLDLCGDCCHRRTEQDHRCMDREELILPDILRGLYAYFLPLAFLAIIAIATINGLRFLYQNRVTIAQPEFEPRLQATRFARAPMIELNESKYLVLGLRLDPDPRNREVILRNLSNNAHIRLRTGQKTQDGVLVRSIREKTIVFERPPQIVVLRLPFSNVTALR